MNNKFKIWCKNNKEWEKDYCVINKNGSLFQDYKGNLIPIRSDTHEIVVYAGISDNSEYKGNYKEEQDVYEKDIIKFTYEDEEYIGYIQFEGAMFIVISTDLPDGYLPLFDILDNDGRIYWLNGQVIGNKFENGELLEK